MGRRSIANLDRRVVSILNSCQMSAEPRLTIFQLYCGITANQHSATTFVYLLSAATALPKATEDDTEHSRGSDAEGLGERVEKVDILLEQGRERWAESRLVGHDKKVGSSWPAERITSPA